LEYKFVLVGIPMSLAMHLEGCLDIVVDPLNIQGNVVLSFFGSIFILRLVKL
jgi:hypothetical protein